MTVTVNTATKEPTPNQFGAMNPVYGSPNTIPTICMSLYPTNVNYPTKKPIESAKSTSQLRKLIPIISGLLTFATVLSILIIFMDTSGIYFYFNCYILKFYILSNLHVFFISIRNSPAEIPLEHDT